MQPSRPSPLGLVVDEKKREALRKAQFSRLTAAAFAIPQNITTDPTFSAEFKVTLQHLYEVGEEGWNYQVPTFDRSQQKADKYLQQMRRLVLQFTQLAGKINEAIRQDIITLLQAHPLPEIKALPVSEVQQLIAFLPENSSRLLSPLEKELASLARAQGASSPAAQAITQVLKQVQWLLALGVCTQRYQAFADRFGQAGAFIDNAPTFTKDRERFYHSTKIKLETLLFGYITQYKNSCKPGVTAAAKKKIIDTIGSFLRELHQQALACADGMAFISDAYDALTQTNHPASWLLEFRQAIVEAIVPGCVLMIKDNRYKIHAKTLVPREANKLGYGIPCLPYNDRHEAHSEIKNAMAYAQRRLKTEFPFNYTYDTVCHVIVCKLRELVRDALQGYQGQVVIQQGQCLPIFAELTIKLRNPPLNFSGLTLEKILVSSVDENTFVINYDFFNPANPDGSLYFIKQAQSLLLGLGMIQHDPVADMELSFELRAAMEQRQLYLCCALLSYPNAPKGVYDGVGQLGVILDKRNDKRQPLPIPQNRAELSYQKEETWQPLLVVRLLLPNIFTEVVSPIKADFLLRMAMEYDKQGEAVQLICEELVKQLAPGLLSLGSLPSLSDAEEGDEASSEKKEAQRPGSPAEQIALLQQHARELTVTFASRDASSLTPLAQSCIRIYRSRASSLITQINAVEKMVCLLNYIPNLPFPFTHDWQSQAAPGVTFQFVFFKLVEQLRGIKTVAEIQDQHFVWFWQCMEKINPNPLLLKILYYQGGIGALYLFQAVATPVLTEQTTPRTETRLRCLLELARWVAIDLSVKRGLRLPGSPGLQLLTPLMAAWLSRNQQQFLQLLALDADPTVDQQPTTLLILNASAHCPDKVFNHLVRKIVLVFAGNESKASAFVNRRSAVGTTALSEVVKHRQLKKLQRLLTHFKELELSAVPKQRASDNVCYDWLDLVAAIRSGKAYDSAKALFLYLYRSTRAEQIDPELERDHLSAAGREILLADKNRKLLREQASLLLTIVQQQCGELALPFFMHLAREISDIDLLLAMSDEAGVPINFDAPRPGVPSLLHQAVQQVNFAQVRALLQKDLDPTQLVGALLLAVQTSGARLIIEALLVHRPLISVDVVDEQGVHLLCHAVSSSCNFRNFSQLVDRFKAESKDEKHRDEGLLAAAQHLLHQPNRHDNIHKLIKLLTLISVDPLVIRSVDGVDGDSIDSLFALINAVETRRWETAIQYYLIYAWQMGITVEEAISPELLTVLRWQGVGDEGDEFAAQLATHRAEPLMGLLHIRALLQGQQGGTPLMAAARFMIDVVTSFTASNRSSIFQSLLVLKHICFPPGYNLPEDHSPSLETFIVFCSALLPLIINPPELKCAIISFMVAANPLAAAMGLVQYLLPQPPTTQIAILQLTKTSILHAYSLDVYQNFFSQVANLLVSTFVYPRDKALFSFMVREMVDFPAALTQIADRRGRTLLMLAALVSWQDQPSATALVGNTEMTVTVKPPKTTQREIKQKEEKSKDEKGTVATLAIVPPLSVGVMTPLDQLLQMNGTPLSAVDENGHHVLFYTLYGPLENFEKIASHLQQHLPRPQWLALVRKPNKAGTTLLSAAVHRQRVDVIFSLLMMDIDLTSFDLSPCQKMTTYKSFYPLMMAIRRDRTGYVQGCTLGMKEWEKLWRFTEFTHLWHELVEFDPQYNSVAVLTQLFTVLTAESDRYRYTDAQGHQHDFYQYYFTTMIKRYAKDLITLQHLNPAFQPLLALLHLCIIKQWYFVDGGILLLHPVIQCVELHTSGVTLAKQLIARTDVDLLCITRDGDSVAEVLMSQINFYQSFPQENNNSSAYLHRSQRYLTGYREVLDELLKNEIILLYHHKKYKNLLITDSPLRPGQRQLAVRCLHALVRLGQCDLVIELHALYNVNAMSQLLVVAITRDDYAEFTDQYTAAFTQALKQSPLPAWLQEDGQHHTAMDRLLTVAREAKPGMASPADLLMKKLQQKFRSLTEELKKMVWVTQNAAQGNQRSGSPSLFTGEPPSLAQVQEVRGLAVQVALEMIKYYVAVEKRIVQERIGEMGSRQLARTTHEMATESLRAYFKTQQLDAHTQLPIIVWQIPDFAELATSLGIEKPDASKLYGVTSY